MSLKYVLKYEDLLEIEQFLREKEFDSGNIHIVMDIETQQRLNRINADYFYKYTKDGSKLEEKDVENVNVQIGNVTFTYKLMEQQK